MAALRVKIQFQLFDSVQKRRKFVGDFFSFRCKLHSLAFSREDINAEFVFQRLHACGELLARSEQFRAGFADRSGLDDLEQGMELIGTHDRFCALEHFVIEMLS